MQDPLVIVVWVAALAALVLALAKGSAQRREGFSAGGGGDDGTWPRDSGPIPGGATMRPQERGRPMDSIFVSVASYRDRDCSSTLRSMYKNASRPELVYAGVVEQNSDDTTESCSFGERLPERLARNVTTLTVPHTEAKGPCYARYQASTLFGGEEYFLQIDSHTSFSRGWDDRLREAFEKALVRSRQPILTTYPMAHDSKDKGTPVLCKSSWNGEGIPTWEAVILNDAAGEEARPVPFTSGGFLFASGKLLSIVPYDPSLSYLFAGEEALYSARCYTHGFDFFTPPAGILTHVYGRSEAPRFWSDGAHKSYKAVQERTLVKVRRLLGLQGPPMEMYPYGMGKVRTVKEWMDFAGLDPDSKSSNSIDKFCSARR